MGLFLCIGGTHARCLCAGWWLVSFNSHDFSVGAEQDLASFQYQWTSEQTSVPLSWLFPDNYWPRNSHQHENVQVQRVSLTQPFLLPFSSISKKKYGFVKHIVAVFISRETACLSRPRSPQGFLTHAVLWYTGRMITQGDIFARQWLFVKWACLWREPGHVTGAFENSTLCLFQI